MMNANANDSYHHCLLHWVNFYSFKCPYISPPTSRTELQPTSACSLVKCFHIFKYIGRIMSHRHWNDYLILQAYHLWFERVWYSVQERIHIVRHGWSNRILRIHLLSLDRILPSENHALAETQYRYLVSKQFKKNLSIYIWCLYILVAPLKFGNRK